MAFRWVYTEPERVECVQVLEKELNIPRQIAHLLAVRGIETYNQAKIFFRPDITTLHDPFLMKDMEAGANRLSQAIRDHQKVLVYGDYDVDGTTATATMVMFLKEFGVDASYYIPHRFKEGYGINPDGIRHAIDIKADLIVSVDCGITAIEESRFARENGIDLIICDHHTVGDELPDAIAVLDPKRPDCDYPFDGLSGAGVGFKLIQATVQKLGLSISVANKYLDLIAISIASDIVPIVDENRLMMREGLDMINTKPRLGIRSLLNLININEGSVSTSSIVFSIGPRINAAGRMGDATTAVELMMADNEMKAKQYAEELEKVNNFRRETDRETMDQAVAMIERDSGLEEISSMVLHHPDWHLGVIGIVASRLVDAYFRPAIMLSSVEGKIKGSARSVKGFNIYEALKQCEDLLEQFGGHEFAAGLTMDKENLEEFKKRMNEIACLKLAENDFKPELQIDGDLDLNMVDMKFWKLLNQFEPFGPGNLRPVFVSKKVKIEGSPTIVGNGHLKMKVSQNDSAVFDVIGFNMHELEPILRPGDVQEVDIAYVLEENNWNGRRTIQMRLKDVHLLEKGES